MLVSLKRSASALDHPLQCTPNLPFSHADPPTSSLVLLPRFPRGVRGQQVRHRVLVWSATVANDDARHGVGGMGRFVSTVAIADALNRRISRLPHIGDLQSNLAVMPDTSPFRVEGSHTGMASCAYQHGVKQIPDGLETLLLCPYDQLLTHLRWCVRSSGLVCPDSCQSVPPDGKA
ncbi:unnamed protein product [Chondrus crispus]|uniref:Uncharacterized protein n=1 Tax=Chondrus crispus TaxID=2769 RepID=R7QKU9_CHOCR|nr:unnamed protein product [Chondrus crispus]CDF37995.1 unnamed protein product [Chondrus crispus]|eukprot:XP_005717864.1 unnamed protein product [Chondrus crispus]